MTITKRTIGRLAAKVGVGVETIRCYERRGLLEQPLRHGSARIYGDEALWRLRYVKEPWKLGGAMKTAMSMREGASK